MEKRDAVNFTMDVRKAIETIKISKGSENQFQAEHCEQIRESVHKIESEIERIMWIQELYEYENTTLMSVYPYK